MKGSRLIPKPPKQPEPAPRVVTRGPRVGAGRVDDARSRAPTILDLGPVVPPEEEAVGHLVEDE